MLIAAKFKLKTLLKTLYERQKQCQSSMLHDCMVEVEATSTNMFKAALQRLPHGAFKSWKQLPAPRGHLTI